MLALCALTFSNDNYITSGWRICDGRNGTPDLRGRVPVGIDATRSESDYHKIHAISTPVFTDTSVKIYNSDTDNFQSHLHRVSGKTSMYGPEVPLPLENRQPYAVVVYVIYLGDINLSAGDSVEAKLTDINELLLEQGRKTVLPDKTVLMIASDSIYKLFNNNGVGFGEYEG